MAIVGQPVTGAGPECTTVRANPHHSTATIPNGGIICLLLAVTLACAGCRSARQPISTSLLDITGESRVTKLKGGPLGWFSLFEQHEAFSVNGLLQMPDVGQEFYFPGHGDPTSALGIAVAQSYKLVGESEVPTTNAVQEVRRALDEVQALSLRLVLVNREIEALRTALHSPPTNGPAGATETAALARNLTGQLDELSRERGEVRSNLFKAQEQFRQAASTPGILIARWRSGQGASAAVRAGSVGRASFAAEKARSGFVILGGLRFVSLVYGEDFWWMLNNLRPHEQRHVRDFGVTTYLIQASNVAYTAELDFTLTASARTSLSIKNPAVPDTVELEAALAQFGQFANAAHLGHITWKREPYCFVCGIDLPELSTNKTDKVIQRTFGAQDKWPDKAAPPPARFEPSYQGWRTVAAKVAHVGRFVATRQPPVFGKRVWEHYEKARAMHGAPACPRCGGVTNAVIPGVAHPH